MVIYFIPSINLKISSSKLGDQTHWEGLVKNKEGETLIQLIEQNVFWDFIEPQVLKYTVSKSLAVIDEPNRLHLKI